MLTPRGPSLTDMRPFVRRSFICALVRSLAEKGCVESYGSAVVTGGNGRFIRANIENHQYRRKGSAAWRHRRRRCKSAVSLHAPAFHKLFFCVF